MKLKSFTPLIAAAGIAFALSLTGCTNAAEQSTSPEGETAEQSTGSGLPTEQITALTANPELVKLLPANIAEAGVLRVATDPHVRALRGLRRRQQDRCRPGRRSRNLARPAARPQG